MEIQRHIPLAPMTTLRVGGSASYYVRVTTETELHDAVLFAETHALPITVIGGGSNILVKDEGVSGLVLSPHFTHLTYHEHDTHTVYVTAGAGVLLDDLVSDTVERGLWGLENLSHIPGTVGGVPIQNVGAYGVEAKDVVVEVRVYDTESKRERILTNTECAFQYRTSLFKRDEGRHFIVLSVTCALTRDYTPRITYKDLAHLFATTHTVTQRAVRDAVIAIRSKKFPPWDTVPTAGSFFKNPIITHEAYTALTEQYPHMPGFPQQGGVKVSLGWILDHVLHLRGYREGNIGLYEAQALVLVTYGDVSTDDIIAFSEKIIAKVYDATGIRIEREVVILG